VIVAWVIAGVAVVGLVVADLGLTVLHPSRHGPMSNHVEHLSWAVVRGLARLSGRGQLLSFGGPTALAADLLAWVSGLWFGFALVYAPFAPGFENQSGGSQAVDGFGAALLLSGESLTTVGFGDVIAGGLFLRLVTVLEAASGLALIAAAIAYVTAVYPRVSLVRSAASWMNDLEADTEDGAARFVCQGGQAEIARLQHDLIEVHQDLVRFPVLYYFHAPDAGESPGSLLRGAALVCAYLRWGLNPKVAPYVELYGPGLERTLERLMADYRREFRGAHAASEEKGSLRRPDAEARFHRMREALRRVSPDAVGHDESGPSEFAEYLARVDDFLRVLGRVHTSTLRRCSAGRSNHRRAPGSVCRVARARCARLMIAKPVGPTTSKYPKLPGDNEGHVFEPFPGREIDVISLHLPSYGRETQRAE